MKPMELLELIGLSLADKGLSTTVATVVGVQVTSEVVTSEKSMYTADVRFYNQWTCTYTTERFERVGGKWRCRE